MPSANSARTSAVPLGGLVKIRLTIIAWLMVSMLSPMRAQEPSLGDLARHERQRPEADRFGGAQLGQPAPLARPGEEVPLHFVRMDGKGRFLDRVALNGKEVLSGTLISVSLPLYVSPYLLDGTNVLEINYTSDPDVGLSVWVEERHPNGATITRLAAFSSEAGETKGRSVRRLVTFEAHPRTLPPVSLTDADRYEILQLVECYYRALAKKNTATWEELWNVASQDVRTVYPEGVEFVKNVMEMQAELIRNPRFKMQPYVADGLEFSVKGQIATVSRTNHEPVFASEPLVEHTVPAAMHAQFPKAEGTVTTKIEPHSLQFKKINGKWALALPFGF